MSIQIGNIELENPYCLAPMAGVTDIGFRRLCKKFGASLTCTEMVSAKGLLYMNAETRRLLLLADNESPKCVQLFGHEPEVFAQIGGYVQNFDIVDINMGCPAPKIFKNGDGSALMGNMSQAAAVIRQVCTYGKPVTVKFRLGIDQNSICVCDFAKMCEQNGASAVTVHARTRAQFYSGQADWSYIERVKQAVTIPVIGNGDIQNKADADRMMAQTGCDAVMIGRGALGRPQLFAQLTGRTCDLSLPEIIEQHYADLQRVFSARFALINMRKHMLWYLKGLKNAREKKERIVRAEDFAEALEIVRSILQDQNEKSAF